MIVDGGSMYGITIDRGSSQSIAHQLTGQLRALVLNGSLAAGMRLPPTRGLSAELHISRNTVLEVYEQLIAEGYLSGRAGSGTYVVPVMKEGIIQTGHMAMPGSVLDRINEEYTDFISFEAGLTDFSHFPRAAWSRAVKEACMTIPEQSYAYGQMGGEEKLRRELSSYLLRTKDIVCSPEQIMIVPGATSGVDLACWALKQTPVVAMEDPCVHFMRQAFLRNGYTIKPIRVDGQGMCTELLADLKDIGVIYVVPSHQFPTGTVLPIGRRLELLYHARRCGSYIIEDDYDSEFRYQGEPIQTLRHLDPDHVIYLGSFSKIFSPTMRIGFMILPWDAIDRIRSCMENINLSVPVLLQLALAGFLESGQLERHIYRMKRVYSRKRALLIQELRYAFGSNICLGGENAGLHLMVSFKTRSLDSADFKRMQSFHVEAEWSEDYAVNKGTHESGIILGYGALTEDEIKQGVARLRCALSNV